MPPIPQMPSTSTPTQKSLSTGWIIALFAVVVLGLIAQYAMFALSDASRAKESAMLSTRMTSLEKAVGDLATKQEANPPAAPIPTSAAPATGPLTYGDLGTDISVKVEKIAFPFTSAELMARATECQTGATQAHVDSVVALFQEMQATRYTFHYLKPTQDGDFVVLVVPNAPKYSTMDAFKKDFDICAAGGDSYPIRLTANNLMFENACGTGFDDGSGKPHGCDVMSKKLEPTLSIQ